MIVPYIISHVKDKQMRKVRGKDINLVLRFALSTSCNSIRASPEKWIKIDNDDCGSKYYNCNDYDDNDDNNLNI